MRRALGFVVLTVLVLGTAACGGGGDDSDDEAASGRFRGTDSERYCQVVRQAEQDRRAQTTTTATVESFDAALARVRDVVPPEIRDDFAVLDEYLQVVRERSEIVRDAENDPANVDDERVAAIDERLRAITPRVTEASAKITQYIEEVCDIRLTTTTLVAPAAPATTRLTATTR